MVIIDPVSHEGERGFVFPRAIGRWYIFLGEVQ